MWKYAHSNKLRVGQTLFLAVNKRLPLMESNVGILQRNQRHSTPLVPWNTFHRSFHVTKAIDKQEQVKQNEVEQEEVEEEEVWDEEVEYNPEDYELSLGFRIRRDDGSLCSDIELGSQFQRDFDRCVDPDEIVLPAEAITNTDEAKWVLLVTDLEHAVKIYPEDPSKGFTRGQLLTFIKNTYEELYMGEEVEDDDIFMERRRLCHAWYEYEENEIRLYVEKKGLVILDITDDGKISVF